ncbi:hypothetical protein, partial [Mucilaginibacter sp.]
KTLKVMIAICFIAVFTQKTIAQSTVSGLYLTAEDYTNHKLSYETNGHDGNAIGLNEFLGSGKITVLFNGKKQSIYKSAVYGYHTNNQDYRYFNNEPYRIVDTKDFYMYSASKLVQQGKGPKSVEAYYFSKTAIDEIKPLSIKNLESTYSANSKFRYMVESIFASDNALTSYDSAVAEYKVKYIYDQSTLR